MAAEDDVLAAPTPTLPPVPSDLKRKFQDLEQPLQHEQVEGEEGGLPSESNPNEEPNSDPEPEANVEAALDAPESATPDVKRPKLDDNKPPLELEARENGFGEDKVEDAKEDVLEPRSIDNEQVNDDHPDGVHTIAEEVQQPDDKEGELSVDGHAKGEAESNNVEKDKPLEEDAEKPSNEIFHEDETPLSESQGQTTSRKMEVPNDKVGVLIGKGGETIRYLQYNSGAKIQITRDADADPHSATRPVEVIGTLGSISKAEKLINAVIAEADAGGSPSLVARGMASARITGVAEQLEMQVPNEKVGLIIGRSGDTIKSLQAKSGARIQLIPQHLPEGDGSKERTVRVTGDKRQIEIAREMILDVMNQTVRPSSLSSGFNQQHSHRPRGPAGAGHWGPRGPHHSQSMPYDYQRGPYPPQNSQYPPLGNYPPQQMGPRSNFYSGWEQRPPVNMQGPHSHGSGYDYYGGHGSHGSDHPASASMSAPLPGHASGPSASVIGPPQSQANYNYGQPHGPDYGHQGPYSQTAAHQQGYGHGYDEPKYDGASTQLPYGHGSSQPVYPQAGNQPGYGAQQQYGKPPTYGMPAQGPPPQSYAPPRPGQPGDMPYQGAIQSSQSYGANVPPQQQYPYASSGPMQQSYPPYGSADGYNQAPPASGPGYPPQGGHSVPSYGQAGGQQAAGYAQGPTGGYGSYPVQQAYPEQAAATNTAGYGYQGPQDPAYGAGTAPAYSATSGQQGYTQAAPTQQTYDQSAQQSGSYGTTPGTATATYGKTVSPQPGYTQYDSTQMYSAPR